MGFVLGESQYGEQTHKGLGAYTHMLTHTHSPDQHTDFHVNFFDPGLTLNFLNLNESAGLSGKTSKSMDVVFFYSPTLSFYFSLSLFF